MQKQNCYSSNMFFVLLRFLSPFLLSLRSLYACSPVALPLLTSTRRWRRWRSTAGPRMHVYNEPSSTVNPLVFGKLSWFLFLPALHAALLQRRERSSPSWHRPCTNMDEDTLPLFVSAFWRFWPPKAATDCQTLSFLVSFYKICLGKNHSKLT
jgi:hypothetical protein